jgi:hypothetical protein
MILAHPVHVAGSAHPLVAEHDGPEIMARIGMMRALNWHRAKTAPAPRRKRPKAYRVIR